VVSALREFKSSQVLGGRRLTSEEAEVNYSATKKVVEARRRAPPTVAWDAGGLYDEHGEPK